MTSIWRRLKKPRKPDINILDAYVRDAPSPLHAFNVFKDEWISKFPPPYAEIGAGTAPLFEDERVAWAINELGGVANQHLLELGPLEGGHSYMLQQAGAASVLSVEANSRAYLKCLIVKELFNLNRVSFQLGDFLAYMDSTQKKFDMIHSAGVLYHMKEPLRLLQLIAQHTDRTYIWTHYYDEKIIQANPSLKRKFSSNAPIEYAGMRATLHRQEYRSRLRQKTFAGGSEAYSHWLTREDILNVLKHFGFTTLTIGHESPNHPSGPNFGLIATK